MLRRALLLAALLAPLTASAQTAVLNDVGPFTVAECEAVPSQLLRVTWTIVPTSVILSDWQYRVLAIPEAESCGTSPPSATARIISTFSVGTHAGLTTATPQATYPGFGTTTSEEMSLGKVVTAAGLTCAGTTNPTVRICVQLLKADLSHVSSQGVTLSLEQVAPAAPTGVTVTPGDSALQVGWTAGTGKITGAATYRAEARACSSDADVDCNSPLAGSATVSGISDNPNFGARIAGLTVGVRYKVQVVAISAAGAEVVSANSAFGVPINVNDFWEQYVADGGQEQGGCGGGPAGALSLLAVAGLTRLLRRRS